MPAKFRSIDLLSSLVWAVLWAILSTIVGSGGWVQADEFFESKVVPIFATHCVGCHNDNDPKGDISVETAAAFFDSYIVEPGNPEDSRLLSVIVGDETEAASMPKNGTPLTAGQVATLRQWIVEGANWPDGVRVLEPNVKNFDWWSFKPIANPAIPKFNDEASNSWIRNPIDAFVLQKLHEQKLVHSTEADRRTLIRRLSFDLTGLPPTYAQVKKFIDDPSSDAYEKLVDRLLASPRYGEKWAQHWLDVVKYADTCGYDKDKLRPNAWPYRDYVIRSFNEDKKYSDFVEEQIAGDELSRTPDGIVALGFIAAGPWDFIGHVEVSESKLDGKVARNLDRDEMVSNTINTFASLTIQCARCHDHKFDPFTQEHYYGLQKIFAAIDRADRPYAPDPEIEKQRIVLEGRLEQLQEREKEIAKQLDVKSGSELSILTARIQELKNTKSTKRPEFGFHGAVASTQMQEQWVEVDLEAEVEIDSIRLRPCHDDFANIGAGFGFPLRYRIEVDGKTIFETGDSDFKKPGLDPVTYLAGVEGQVEGQVVRITAMKLAPRATEFVFALAELEVLDAEGKNLALQKPVRALNTVEAPVRWATRNLTDGIWFEGPDSGLESERTSAESALVALKRKLLGDEVYQESLAIEARIPGIQKELRSLPMGPMVYAAATHFKPEGNFHPTNGKPREVRLLRRGNVDQPSEDELSPSLLPLSESDSFLLDLPDDVSEGELRAKLAVWLTDPTHPLTWRSIVNRIWQHHFGRGIVATPNDFGRMGALPTHPELLDWLAQEFLRNGGRFKHLHRMIVLSSTYRQDSRHEPVNAGIDSDNRFLWRMNRRRLTAEEVRDSMLAATGKLDLKMGGPGFYLFALEKTEHSPHYEYHKFDGRDESTYRRSVYRFVVRSQPDPLMTTLDCADASQSTPRRNETQTALQALALLNNPFNLVMAEQLAARMEEQQELELQIERAFQVLLVRDPTAEETMVLAAYAKQHGTKNLARVLFNLNEFVYID